MSKVLEQLQDALDKFANSVTKDLNEIREHRNAVQQIQRDMDENVRIGRIIRDDKRLILSAPEIVIGNVDNSGNLIGEGGGSVVVVRGNNVSIEGAGAAGQIVNRAQSIRSVAVDPGVDGRQAILYPGSEVVAQASGISLVSTSDSGCIVTPASGGSGVNIQSDTSVNVHATPSCKIKKSAVDNRITSLKTADQKLQSQIEEMKSSLKDRIDTIGTLISASDTLIKSETLMRSEYDSLKEAEQLYQVLERDISELVVRYVRTIAERAEINRQMTALNDMKTALGKKEADFKDIKKKSTQSSVSIAAESVSITNRDGDGNLRENSEAGFFVRAPHVVFGANDKDGKLVENSKMSINTQDLTISTSNPNIKMDKGKPSGEIKNGEKGSIVITSKDITVQAIDQKYEGDKLKESALVKDSKFTLRTENVSVSNTDTEGKSTGTINLNAKDIKIAAYDVDKEKRTDKEMAKGSQMQLLTEKVFVGSNKEKKAVELVQVAGKSVGIMGKETAEMQEGEAKSVVTLNGGNVTAGGSKVELKGNTTIEGNADIKGEAKAPKVTADQVDVKSAFKSPNINDTMGAGMPGQAGKPSAKLKEEEAAAAKGGSK